MQYTINSSACLLFIKIIMFLLFIVQRKTPKDAAWKTYCFAYVISRKRREIQRKNFGAMSRVEGRGSRVEGRGSRVEGRGSRVEGRGSRVEGRGSRVEGRGSRVYFTNVLATARRKIDVVCLIQICYWFP